MQQKKQSRSVAVGQNVRIAFLKCEWGLFNHYKNSIQFTIYLSAIIHSKYNQWSFKQDEWFVFGRLPPSKPQITDWKPWKESIWNIWMNMPQKYTLAFFRRFSMGICICAQIVRPFSSSKLWFFPISDLELFFMSHWLIEMCH